MLIALRRNLLAGRATVVSSPRARTRRRFRIGQLFSVVTTFLAAWICSQAASGAPPTPDVWHAAFQGDATDHSGKVHFRKMTLESGGTTVDLLLAFGNLADLRCEIVTQMTHPFTSVQDAVEQAEGVAGVNGGYFKADGEPVGWLVANGKTLHRWERARLLSGVLWIQKGRPRLQRTNGRQVPVAGEDAIQSGPFLIERASPVPGLEGTRRAPRTFVYLTREGRFGIGTARSATLAETASFLAGLELDPGDRLDRCLNLDGGSSTAFFGRTSEDTFNAPTWVRPNNCLVIALRRR